MKKTILLFAACASMALAIAGPLANSGYSLAYEVSQAMPMAIAFIGLALYLVAPAAQFVARHVKQSLSMLLQPGGRSPVVSMISAMESQIRTASRKQITVTGAWRLCPST